MPNTTCRACNNLFIIEAEKFSVTHKRPFFLRLKKNTQASTFVTIFLRQWKKLLTVFCEIRRLEAFPWDALVYELLPKVRMSDKVSSNSKLV